MNETYKQHIMKFMTSQAWNLESGDAWRTPMNASVREQLIGTHSDWNRHPATDGMGCVLQMDLEDNKMAYVFQSVRQDARIDQISLGLFLHVHWNSTSTPRSLQINSIINRTPEVAFIFSILRRLPNAAVRQVFNEDVVMLRLASQAHYDAAHDGFYLRLYQRMRKMEAEGCWRKIL